MAIGPNALEDIRPDLAYFGVLGYQTRVGLVLPRQPSRIPPDPSEKINLLLMKPRDFRAWLGMAQQTRIIGSAGCDNCVIADAKIAVIAVYTTPDRSNQNRNFLLRVLGRKMSDIVPHKPQYRPRGRPFVKGQ